MAFEIEEADVVVCGGGPTGLLTALSLQKLGISTCVIGKRKGEFEEVEDS